MTGKERLFLFSILLIAMLLLPLTLKAASEEEMVQQFLAKNDAVKKRTMVAPFFSFSYGKVDPAGYHNFTGETNKYVRMVNSTDATALASIHRITSFEGGLSLLVDRGLLSAAFDYWLTVGSSKKGDFEFYTDLTAGTHEDVEDFNLRSEIKVWGVYLDYQYFIHNPPVPYFGIRGLSAKAGAGIGYYGAYWDLWEGFAGFIEGTDEYYVLTDHLKGSGPGFHLSAGIEYPAWKGLILAADAKYVWLKFDKLSKQMTETYELYLVNSDTHQPIDIDFSGPRLNLSIKHYFTL
ncbi:MAG: hypothetical protein ABIK83_13020 [Candidatus Zixiibacteriota bacterium]